MEPVIFDRFKPNVHSTVIKANPLTLPFGFIDAGVEFRNQKTGWVFMNHSFFSTEATQIGTGLNDRYIEPRGYVRFTAEHRWYRQIPRRWRGELERYTGLYINTGMYSYAYTDNTQLGVGGLIEPVGPLTDAQRLDLILGVNLGRTRNPGMPDSPFYWETSWKLGYNLGSGLPHLVYGIRFNYVVR